jgi:MFS family permease
MPEGARAQARVGALLFTVAWGTNHFVPLLLLYRVRLGLSPSALAQTFAIYALGLLPGLLLGGPLSDRVGRRALVVPAALVALGGTAILGAGAAGFTRLLLGRFVVGLGSGATFSAATAWVQDLATVKGAGARRATVVLSAGFGGGPLVASFLAQWLPLPLVVPYAVQAVALLAAIVGVARMPAPARSPRRTPDQPRRFVPAGFLREVVPVAPWVFGLPSIAFAVLPALVRDRVGGWAVVYAGVVTATTLFSGLLAQGPLRAFGSAAAGRFGVTVGCGGLLIAALAIRLGSPAGVLVAAAVMGAAYGGCMVAGLRFVETRAAPADRGRVTGIFYVLAYVGFVAPLVCAEVARRHGPVATLLGAAGVALVSVALRWLDREGSKNSS